MSDLHFGRIDERLLDPLVDAVRRLAPDVVAVSGDLTQRARSREFREARDFLARLPGPRIVVPGNHDVPLDRPARFLWPLRNWRRYITEDLEPCYSDEEIIVAGINTARSLTWKGGRISREQVGRAFARLCAIDPWAVKIVVTHHPFDLPSGHNGRDLLGRAAMAMAEFARCGADVFLAGHLHLGYVTRTAERYRIQGHSALVVQAGTAISTRARGEFNAFTVLRVRQSAVVVDRWVWDGRGAFAPSEAERFERTSEGWGTAA
jgi:3',5'-cyclic AMP phosphodiesterase CpdA